jgi:hypothetical protein
MISRKQISPEARDTYLITSVQTSSIADRVIGICPVRSQLVSMKAVHGTAAGQTCTLSIERLQGTEVSGAGDVVTEAMDMEATANTVQSGTITTTSDIHIWEAGNRVGVHMNGTTTTSLATLVVVCQFRPVDA